MFSQVAIDVVSSVRIECLEKSMIVYIKTDSSHLQGIQKTSTIISDDDWRAISDSLELSSRQFEILKHVVDGSDDDVTSEKLGISVHTVRSHIKRIRQKLGVHSRADLVSRVFLSYLVDVCETD